MKITKIFHSCVLLEENGAKILLDPGAWVFGENYLDKIDADAVLVTHEHQDHYFPDELKEFGGKIITNASLAQKMKEAGIKADVLQKGKSLNIMGFSVSAFDCPHGSLPVPCPENVGFLINKVCTDAHSASFSLFAPGDSLEFHKEVQNIDVLLAPVIAPWMRVAEGIDFVKRVKPKITVPVHDGFMKYPFALNMFSKVLEEAGFNVQAKDPGMSFET